MVYSHRKLIVGSIIVFISFLMINSPAISNQINPLQAHSMTLGISPVEEEFVLNVDFYYSEHDAIERENNWFGAGFRVEPSNHIQTKSMSCDIRKNQLFIWVKIYFDEISESPCNILQIGKGQIVTSTLLGIEISIIIEPQ